MLEPIAVALVAILALIGYALRLIWYQEKMDKINDCETYLNTIQLVQLNVFENALINHFRQKYLGGKKDLDLSVTTHSQCDGQIITITLSINGCEVANDILEFVTKCSQESNILHVQNYEGCNIRDTIVKLNKIPNRSISHLIIEIRGDLSNNFHNIYSELSVWPIVLDLQINLSEKIKFLNTKGSEENDESTDTTNGSSITNITKAS